MCGIAGIVWVDGRPADSRRDVSRMTDAIAHRGPDSTGASSSAVADVGFRRLSIIDLAGGSQPLCNEDGSIECFLNGEIFNYIDLRNDLVARGHQFRTRSDTEVLPHLYEEHGADMFTRLNGMFGICIVDHRRKQVLLARDHFGVKPMYYFVGSKCVVFGSELKAVLASGQFEPELDEASVPAYLALFYCPAPHTLVRHVRKLLPGHCMEAGPSGINGPRAFYPSVKAVPQSTWSPGDAVEAVRSSLKRAVRLQLQSDVPVAISLSGGLDSTALAWAASDGGSDGISAITVSYPDTAATEVNGATELCRRFGIRHQVVSPEVGDVAGDLPLLAWMADEPVADPALYSQWCIARCAARHVKVLLSGAGGDELFGGYGSYFLSRKRQVYSRLPGYARGLLRPVCRAMGLGRDEVAALDVYQSRRLMYHIFCMSSLDWAECEALRASVPGARPPFAQFEAAYDRHARFDAENQQMLIDLHTYLPDQVLPMLDRATMAASIEGRVPFLDVPLAECVFSMPASIKLGRPHAPKKLLKECLRPYVPAMLLNSAKIGMPSPIQAFIRSAGAEWLSGILLHRKARLPGLVGESTIRSWLARPLRHWRVIYSALLLEVWHRLFIAHRIFHRPGATCADLMEVPAGLRPARTGADLRGSCVSTVG